MTALEHTTSLSKIVRCPGMTVFDLKITLQERKAATDFNDGLRLNGFCIINRVVIKSEGRSRECIVLLPPRNEIVCEGSGRLKAESATRQL